MANEAINIYATGNAPAKDWFLQFLVNLANKNHFELDLTLSVGGILVSGTLIGVREYFDDISSYFAGGSHSGKNSEVIKRTFQEIGDQCTCVSPSEKTENPSYIHLKNATFADGQGKPFSRDEGTWWRGRLSEVHGFSLGRLAA